MKRLGRAIDRFLYIVWRDWRDWYAFAWLVVIVAAVFGLGAAIWTTVARYTAHDWHVFGVYMLSEFLLFLPFAQGKTKKIRDLDGEVLVWTIDAITRHGYIVGLRDRMLGDAFGAALWGGGIGDGLLIGAVVVLRIVHWRNSMQRRQGTGEMRAAKASRRWIGRRVNSILCFLPVSVRFVRKRITRYAVAGGTDREGASSAVDKPYAAEAAEALAGRARFRFDRRSDGEAPNTPSGTPVPATSSSPAPTASPPAAPEASANPNRSELSNRLPHAPGRVSRDMRAIEAGGVASPKPGPSQERPAAGRDVGSDSDPPTVPHGERAVSDDRMPESKGRPLPIASRHGSGRRRRRASQDFY